MNMIAILIDGARQVGCLDILLFNLDRHEGNVLLHRTRHRCAEADLLKASERKRASTSSNEKDWQCSSPQWHQLRHS